MTLEKMITSIVLTAALSFVAFTTAAPQASNTLTGTVTDQACGATHQMKNMSPADCARACAKKAGWALVVGDKVYKLQGDEGGPRICLRRAFSRDSMAASRCLISVSPSHSG